MAHAVSLGERSTSAIAVYSTDTAANSAVQAIHGKCVQHEGVVFINQKVSAVRPSYFTVRGTQTTLYYEQDNTFLQNLATANPSVVWQELIHDLPLEPLSPQHMPSLRKLACDGPLSRSPSPAQPAHNPEPTTPAMAPKARRRTGPRHRRRAMQPHDDGDSIKALHSQDVLSNTVAAHKEQDGQRGQENCIPAGEGNRLCMMGLPWDASHTTLQALCEAYGELHSTHLSSRRGRSRIGFVTMHSREAAERAMQDLNGRQVKVQGHLQFLMVTCITHTTGLHDQGDLGISQAQPW